MTLCIGVQIGDDSSVGTAASEGAWETTVRVENESSIEHAADSAADGYADRVAGVVRAIRASTSETTTGLAVAHPDDWSADELDAARAAVSGHEETAGVDVTWVPRAVAAVVAAEHTYGTFPDGVPVVSYDLGATGLTVSVVRTGEIPEAIGRPMTAAVAPVPVEPALATMRDRSGDGMRVSTAASADVVREALTTAGLTPEEVTALVVTGAAATNPMVSELLRDTLHIPVVLDPDPTSAAAGAALLNIRGSLAPTAAFAVDDAPTSPLAVAAMADGAADVVSPSAGTAAQARSRRTVALALVAAASAAVVGAGLWAAIVGKSEHHTTDAANVERGATTSSTVVPRTTHPSPRTAIDVQTVPSAPAAAPLETVTRPAPTTTASPRSVIPPSQTSTTPTAPPVPVQPSTPPTADSTTQPPATEDSTPEETTPGQGISGDSSASDPTTAEDSTADRTAGTTTTPQPASGVDSAAE